MSDLRNRVAIVTGAGSGIGRAIALALHVRGAAVCIADIDETGGRAVESEIIRAGGQATFIPTDVSQGEAVRAMVEGTVRALGEPGILVNNAGLQHVSPVVDFPEERWHHIIGVMLTGTFLCTKYTLPYMIRRRWGRVVNVASVHGLIASPFKAAYVSAKHGVVGFTKTVAWEVAGDGVTVNAVCPGYVRTPLVEKQIAAQARVHGIPEEEVVRHVMLEPQAMKRLLEPEEVAALTIYLCSDEAAGLTGAALPIDGGWTAH
jgi:3-hydroxybutyrate dehydrogenase